MFENAIYDMVKNATAVGSIRNLFFFLFLGWRVGKWCLSMREIELCLLRFRPKFSHSFLFNLLIYLYSLPFLKLYYPENVSSINNRKNS